MAKLPVFIPILMLGLVLALGRYEELLLPEQRADRHAPALTPPAPAPVPTASLAPSLGNPAASIASGSAPPSAHDRSSLVLSEHSGGQAIACRHLMEAWRCLDDLTEFNDQSWRGGVGGGAM
jgi:hypothetical protein